MSYALRKMGQPERGLEFAERALAIAPEIDHPTLMIEVLRVQGDNLLALGRYDEARETFQAAYDLARQPNWPYEMTHTLIGLSHAYRKLGDYSRAWEASEEAIRNAQKIGFRLGELMARAQQGRMLGEQKRFGEAQQMLLQAITLAEAIGVKEMAMECHSELSDLFKETGNFERALHHYHRFYEIEKEIHGQEAHRKLAALTVRLETERTQKEKEELEKAQAELQALYTEKTALMAELQSQAERHRRIAEVLQEAVLPTIPESIIPGLRVNTVYQPASDEAAVGGDFYDVFPLSGDRVALAVGDVVGHGLQAALSISEVRFALRGYLSGNPSIDPAQALDHLNRFMIESNRLWRIISAGPGQKPPQRNGMVALTFVVLDLTTGTFAVAAAGMDPLLVVRASNGAVEQIDASDLMLGVDIGADYRVVEGRLRAGDLLVAMTDGITEARSSGSSEQFRLERVGSAIRDAIIQAKKGSISLAQIGKEVVSQAQAFTGGTFTDDICILFAQLAEAK